MTTHFNLARVDAQTAAPFSTCSNNTGTLVVESGTLALTGTSFTVRFEGLLTQNAVTSAQSYQQTSTFSVKGSNYTFHVNGVGTFPATLTNGVLTVPNYPYCNALHTLVYQRT